MADDKPYCGIAKLRKGQRLGTARECTKLKQIRYYGLNKINPEDLLLEPEEDDKNVRNDLLKQKSILSGKRTALVKKNKASKDAEEKKKLSAEFKIVTKQLNDLNKILNIELKRLEDLKPKIPTLDRKIPNIKTPILTSSILTAQRQEAALLRPQTKVPSKMSLQRGKQKVAELRPGTKAKGQSSVDAQIKKLEAKKDRLEEDMFNRDMTQMSHAEKEVFRQEIRDIDNLLRPLRKESVSFRARMDKGAQKLEDEREEHLRRDREEDEKEKREKENAGAKFKAQIMAYQRLAQEGEDKEKKRLADVEAEYERIFRSINIPTKRDLGEESEEDVDLPAIEFGPPLKYPIVSKKQIAKEKKLLASKRPKASIKRVKKAPARPPRRVLRVPKMTPLVLGKELQRDKSRFVLPKAKPKPKPKADSSEEDEESEEEFVHLSPEVLKERMKQFKGAGKKKKPKMKKPKKEKTLKQKIEEIESDARDTVSGIVDNYDSQIGIDDKDNPPDLEDMVLQLAGGRGSQEGGTMIELGTAWVRNMQEIEISDKLTAEDIPRIGIVLDKLRDWLDDEPGVIGTFPLTRKDLDMVGLDFGETFIKEK